MAAGVAGDEVGERVLDGVGEDVGGAGRDGDAEAVAQPADVLDGGPALLAADADLVAVTDQAIGDIDERYLDVIRSAEARGAWVLSVCSGAFVLAQAGVLEGRRATTHWMYADRLARENPGTDVNPEVLFIDDRKVVTGAGTAAGIDAALHVVRVEHGAAATNVIARRMVVPPQRDGGQSQYIPTPVAECQDDSLADVIEWMLENLAEDLTIEQLSRRALMSTRTFARRFRAEVGATPAAWLNTQRILRARDRPDKGQQMPAPAPRI